MKIETRKIPIVLNDPKNPIEGMQMGVLPGGIAICIRKDGTEMVACMPLDQAVGIAHGIIQMIPQAVEAARKQEMNGVQSALGHGIIKQ